MADAIFDSWLRAQYTEAMGFAERSDVLRLAPIAGAPPHKYVAEFRCRGLVRTNEGVAVADRHLVGILFPETYLNRSANPGEVLTWLEPRSEFHPNILPPFACIGSIVPGMSLLALLGQLYQMITWQRFTPREDDALNADACCWARNNLGRLPVDDRRSMLRPGPGASAPEGRP